MSKKIADKVFDKAVNHSSNIVDNPVASEMTNRGLSITYSSAKAVVNTTKGVTALGNVEFLKASQKLGNKILGNDNIMQSSNTHYIMKPNSKYQKAVKTYTGHKAAVYQNYSGIKKVYFKADDFINGRGTQDIRFVQNKFFKNHGKIKIETKRPFKFKHSKTIGKWKYKNKVLTEKEYKKMYSQFNPNFLDKKTQSLKKEIKHQALSGAASIGKNIATTPVKSGKNMINNVLSHNDDTGSRLITGVVNSTSQAVTIGKSITVGSIKTFKLASRVTVGAGKLAWNTPKVAVKTVKTVKNVKRSAVTTRSVVSMAKKRIEKFAKDVTVKAVSAAAPFIVGILAFLMMILIVMNIISNLLMLVFQASYTVESNSFKIFTDTISLQDAAYQGALDEGRFLELKGAVESGSFDSSSFYQNNIDESKIYSEEYAWDEATIDEWQHVTTAKIHTDRLAIFDYVNSKYRESESDTQYIKNLDELDENETSEPKKVKQYSNYEIKNDLLDLWAKLQFLSLRVYNKDNFDKPIFDLMGDSVTAYDYIDWKKEVIKITGTKTYKDEDNDTRVEEYDQTYNVYDTNVRFDCYADDVKAYQDVFKDDSRIVDVANTNTYNGYDLYISQYWSMSSGRQSEKYYIQDTDELGEDWGWRTSNPNECYKISQWYWNNDVYECAFEGFITVQEFNEKVNSGAFKLWHYEIDDSEEYYFNNSKDALSDNTQLFRKVNIFDGDNNIVQDGYINVPIYEERQNEISSHADLYAFANDMPIDSWYGGMYRWTHYYEQIYYCIEAHKSIPLRYYLERDLEHAMSRSDRPQEENETSVQMYEALRDFDANETSAFIGNIFDDKIVSLKRENGYRHAKEASGRNADIMMFNDDKYKWNHLEVYSESGWEVYAPMSGELSIGKLPSFYRSIIGEEEDTSDYLIIGGTKEWEVPKDKSAWKKFKENVSNLFTGGEGGDTPNYRQQCLYIKLSDIALKDKLKDEINEKGYATIISGIVLGTCSGETMQLIPTYNSWENGEMYAEPYDLGVYMSETAATISALSDRRLDRESLGYEILSCAEKYRFYSYYKDIYYMGNEATSFSSAGLVKHVLNKISESEKNVFETDVTTISSEKDLKKRSKITYSPQTGDLIFLEKNGEIKYVGFVADAKNHTMFLQEDAYAEYAHYANWKHSEWKDYNITFGKLELKEEKIK